MLHLIVDNSEMSVRDVAHALWREGRDKVAIAGALLEVARAMTGDPCPDAAIEILAPLDGRAEAGRKRRSAPIVTRTATSSWPSRSTTA